MEDVITEAPPPSRFFEEDLNTFTQPSPPLPSPSLIFSQPQPHQPLKPTYLIIDLSLFNHNHHSSKPLLASLAISNNNTINIHSLSNDTVFVSAHSPIAPDRAVAVAKLLVGDRILPGSVLILDSIRPRNYRGRLSSDEAVGFKLETSAERKRGKGEKLLEGLEYYPSGSVVDGLGAAILGRCQVLNIRASLFVSWPQFDDDNVVSLLKGVLQNGVLSGLDFSHEVFKFGRSKGHAFQSDFDMYI